MGIAWNNIELKIEQVSESEMKLQSYKDLKRESDKAIKKMKNIVNNFEKKQSLDISEYTVECQNAINEIRYCLEKVMLVLGVAINTKVLNDQLYGIIYVSLDGTCSERGFLYASEACHRAVGSYCNDILSYDPDEDELKEEEALSYMIGKGKNKSEDVFDVYFKSIVNLCKKFANKLESQYNVNYSRDVFGAVGSKISSEYFLKCSNSSTWMKVVMNTLSKPDDKIFEALLRKLKN